MAQITKTDASGVWQGFEYQHAVVLLLLLENWNAVRPLKALQLEQDDDLVVRFEVGTTYYQLKHSTRKKPGSGTQIKKTKLGATDPDFWKTLRNWSDLELVEGDSLVLFTNREVNESDPLHVLLYQPNLPEQRNIRVGEYWQEIVKKGCTSTNKETSKHFVAFMRSPVANNAEFWNRIVIRANEMDASQVNQVVLDRIRKLRGDVCQEEHEEPSWMETFNRVVASVVDDIRESLSGSREILPEKYYQKYFPDLLNIPVSFEGLSEWNRSISYPSPEERPIFLHQLDFIGQGKFSESAYMDYVISLEWEKEQARKRPVMRLKLDDFRENIENELKQHCHAHHSKSGKKKDRGIDAYLGWKDRSDSITFGGDKIPSGRLVQGLSHRVMGDQPGVMPSVGWHPSYKEKLLKRGLVVGEQE